MTRFILVFSLAWSNSLFLHCFFVISLISSLWYRQWWGIFHCCCLFSAIVYILGLNLSDQVRAGTVRGRGTAQYVLREGCQHYAWEWHFLDTPLGSDWLCWAGSSGFMQIELGPLVDSIDSGFFCHLCPILLLDQNDNFSKYNKKNRYRL